MKGNLKVMKGFTLIEILVTIVILVILAGITIVALNPGQNIDDANDAVRRADVNTILNAVWQYAVDNDGALPAEITAATEAISNAAANICADIVDEYIAEVPADPTTGSYTDCATYASGYTISRNAAGTRVTVNATLSDATTYSQTR
ncbi:MAG: prepilin-type N-terminal cleavage/methylation domain-containing protein [bacterium]|nr:prepilin-type N-terminal cleavage/methylation domain-containing protein [bacterium]